MKLYFLRHGEAKDKDIGMEDSDRPLTSFGAAMISNVGRSLKKELDTLDLILTSPLLRAVQTADIVGNIFGAKEKIKKTEGLRESLRSKFIGIIFQPEHVYTGLQ